MSSRRKTKAVPFQRCCFFVGKAIMEDDEKEYSGLLEED